VKEEKDRGEQAEKGYRQNYFGTVFILFQF
jgi:hypothetical protein